MIHAPEWPVSEGPPVSGAHRLHAMFDIRHVGSTTNDTLVVRRGALDTLVANGVETAIQLAELRQSLEPLHTIDHLAAAAGAIMERDDTRATGSAARGRAAARGTLDEIRALISGVRGSARARFDAIEQSVVRLCESAQSIGFMPVADLFAQLEAETGECARSQGHSVNALWQSDDLRADARVLLGVREAVRPLLRAATDSIDGGHETSRARTVTICASAARRRDALVLSLAIFAPVRVPDAQLVAASQSALEALGARLSVINEGDAAYRLEVVVSETSSLVSVVALEADSTVSYVPTHAARMTLRVDSRDLVQKDGAVYLGHQARSIPFVPLARLTTSRVTSRSDARMWTVVVVAADGRELALGVDAVVGRWDVMVRPVPADAAESASFVAGISLDGDRAPRVVLDPAALVAIAVGVDARTVSLTFPVRRPVLVVDDSLTSRMLEKSVLELAGYEVELACSGEEGLSMMAARRYGLVVVDAEMPGISGFEFAARVRVDSEFRRIPVIMVTSRSSTEDRKRATMAGVSAYIVKGEFDPTTFLGHVRQLMIVGASE